MMSDDWEKDAADLPANCRMAALEAAALLRGPCTQETQRHIKAGFISPAPEALLHAASVFESISELPGGTYWMQRPRPIDSLNLICALAGAITSIEREWDLSTLSAWWAWRESQPSIERAVSAYRLVNAGLLDKAIAILTASFEEAEREFILRR